MSRVFKVSDLFICLVKLGFHYCKPKSRTWTSAFLLRKGDSVLCVLFRKNGIDLRYYEQYAKEITVHPGNFATFRGGELFRNHFNESENLITKKIAVVASCFAKGTVHPEMRKEDGRSYLLNPQYERTRRESKEKFAEISRQLKEDADERGLAAYLRDDCGGYLGDGIWV